MLYQTVTSPMTLNDPNHPDHREFYVCLPRRIFGTAEIQSLQFVSSYYTGRPCQKNM